MKPETDSLEQFLECTEVIDWESPEIRETVRSIVLPGLSDVAAARKLFEWVRDRIPHSMDAGLEIVTCKASDVLKHRTGICYAKAHLLGAMLRAAGIPAGFSYQVLRHDPPNDGLVVHGFNGVYLASPRRWLRIDCRGNTGGINAQFCLEGDQLAFLPNAEKGEFTDERIFVAPIPAVVQCLKEHTSVTAMWPHLPSALPPQ